MLRFYGEFSQPIVIDEFDSAVQLMEAAVESQQDIGNLSFWAAANSRASGLGLMDRQRVKVWTREGYDQIDALGESVFSAPIPDKATAEPGRF